MVVESLISEFSHPYIFFHLLVHGFSVIYIEVTEVDINSLRTPYLLILFPNYSPQKPQVALVSRRSVSDSLLRRQLLIYCALSIEEL